MHDLTVKMSRFDQLKNEIYVLSEHIKQILTSDQYEQVDSLLKQRFDLLQAFVLFSKENNLQHDAVLELLIVQEAHHDIVQQVTEQAALVKNALSNQVKIHQYADQDQGF